MDIVLDEEPFSSKNIYRVLSAFYVLRGIFLICTFLYVAQNAFTRQCIIFSVLRFERRKSQRRESDTIENFEIQ